MKLIVEDHAKGGFTVTILDEDGNVMHDITADNAKQVLRCVQHCFGGFGGRDRSLACPLCKEIGSSVHHHGPICRCLGGKS